MTLTSNDQTTADRRVPDGPVNRRTRSLRAEVTHGISPKVALMVADTVAITLAMIGAFLIENLLVDFGVGGAARQYLFTALVTLPGWLLIFANQRLYNTRFIARRIDEFR